LFWVEAEEVCVVAAAPVRTRTATRVRIASFMELAPWVEYFKLLIRKGLERLISVGRAYRPWAIPQAFGSSGGQVGIGSMLTRAVVTLFLVEAEEV
jgi:hypothetical protein